MTPDARFRRASRASVFTFLVLLGFLGAIAVGNGLWSKTLLANGLVETGDVNAVWGPVSTDDAGTTADPCSPRPGPNCPATPVHIATCSYVSGIGSDTASAQITGAYPGYECTITGNISNVGSVPFNIAGAHLVINNGNENGLAAAGSCTLPSNLQVDPANMSPVSCKVHVTAAAQDGVTYYFALETCVAQWNEDPALSGSDFDACKASPQHEGPITPTLPAPSTLLHPTDGSSGWLATAISSADPVRQKTNVAVRTSLPTGGAMHERDA